MILEDLKRNKAVVFRALQRTTVAKISVTYWGHGDSGEIDDKQLVAKSGKPLKRLPKSAADTFVTVKSSISGKMRKKYLGAAIEDLFYDLLDVRLKGWANGSYGTMELDVLSEKLRYNSRTDEGRTRSGSV